MVNEEHKKENDNENHEDLMSEEPNWCTTENDNENMNENDENEDSYREYGNLNIYDPGNWDKIDQNMRDLIVERGPIRDCDRCDFPIDTDYGRSFDSTHYVRILSNGEKQDRKWLVY